MVVQPANRTVVVRFPDDAERIDRPPPDFLGEEVQIEPPAGITVERIQ